MRDFSQKTGYKFIKTLFRATKTKLWSFNSVHKNKVLLPFVGSVLSVCIITVLSILVISEIQAKRSDRFQPTYETLHVFPEKISAVGFENVDSLVFQNVKESGLYQDYNQYNSAYLTNPDVTFDSQSTSSSEQIDDGESTDVVNSLETEVVTPSSTTSSSTVPISTPVATTSVQSVLEASTTITQSIDPNDTQNSESGLSELEDSTTTPEADIEHTTSTGEQIISFFKQVAGVFKFAQEGTTTLLGQQVNDEMVSSSSSKLVDDPILEETSAATSSGVVTATTTSTGTSTATEVSPPVTSAPTFSSVIGTSSTDNEASSDPDPVVSTSAPATVASTTTTGSTEEESGTMSLASTTTHTITMSNFAVPVLSPGQFIENLQLRLSLGAQYSGPTTTYPVLEATYELGSLKGKAGIVLITEEVSNALNGGHAIIALPSISDATLLEDLSITLTYEGRLDEVDLFVDAAWIEIQTAVYDKQLLRDRAQRERMDHLRLPQMYDFISEYTDFSREENPVFTMRYESQRNVLVRTVRNFVGRDLAQVKRVRVLRKGVEPTAVSPLINMTSDGLLTIAFEDDDREQMKPGTYEVEVVVREGGKEFKDSFEFQWGLLAINTNKTEYTRGDVAQISMGALTPNGHTLCDAALELYVVDPTGFVTSVPVSQSGQCKGNNVIDVPDYSAHFVTTVPGEYEMFLERVDEDGSVISHTMDTFTVVNRSGLHIERVGPTRIYPPSPYAMELTVVAPYSGFTGELIERVPKEFEIFNTDADIRENGNVKELVWDTALLSSSTKTFSYEFDAPDVSPYLYQLGPAELAHKKQTISSTSSSTPDFKEHRRWQIASDAVGAMIMFYDGSSGNPAPQGWICLSCTSTGTFYQRFVMGSSTYNSVGGTATHTHSATGIVDATLDAAVSEAGNTQNISNNLHGHTYDPNISEEQHLPPYRQLRVIQYGSVEEPPSIPTGAIGIFDVASSSLPTGWTRYTPQDGLYVYGENTVGTTGGTVTHAHTVDGSTSAGDGVGERNRNGGVGAALLDHTHTVSTSTDEVSNEPPYVEVLLARMTATSTSLPNGLITMWTEDVPTGWLDISSTPGDTFSNKFIKPAATYGSSGGTSTHAHADIIDELSSQAIGTDSVRSGSDGADDNHDHEVDVVNFSTEILLPPYVTAVFGKRSSNNPIYEQLSFRWYDDQTAEPPTDPWPDGATDIVEGEAITATSTPVVDLEPIRLRINVAVSNSSSTAGASFKLQYATSTVCSTATNWYTVGDTASTTAWRGYDTAGIANEAAVSSGVLSSTTILQAFYETGNATNSPNEIAPDGVGEWDFSLQEYATEAGTNYCFRMVRGDGSAFTTYTSYPEVLTNAAPVAPTLNKLFDNEKTASSTPEFEFVSTDEEGQLIIYQIQVDDNYDFTSNEINRNSLNHTNQFLNLTNENEKNQFTSGETIRFTPIVSLATGTYYWRVRGRDASGSNEWGDWSSVYSFTTDGSLASTAWYQTETEQFDTNTLVDVATANGSTSVTAATGTMTGTAIDFTDGSIGTAWGSVVIAESDSSSVLDYYLEYLDESSTWTRIPDADLAGNAAGFSTTTINLLTLDVGTYEQIRLVADFTANTGSPRLESWQVNWGFRVETPTLTTPFSSEKVGTTTPLFVFSSSDPQSDPLEYEISWSEDPTFVVSSTTRNSSTSAGFANQNNGAESNPFTSGDTMEFRIQGVDALQNDTTYWWRVRAKDPLPDGQDAWSFWSDAQSFTVATDTFVSTWFQTTEEQFDSDTLSGTNALANDSLTVATTALAAMIVYGEGNDSIPKSRWWNGTTLGSATDMQDVGAAIRAVRVAAGTTREEYVAVTSDTTNDINVQFFSDGSWGDLQQITSSMGDITTRGFDVAYETFSGDAMVVYCDGDTTPQYALWNGDSWTTTSGTTNITLTAACEWVQVAADPTSNEIIAITRDANGADYIAAVWNATTSTWGNTSTLNGITEADHEGMAVMYEESGDDAIIVGSLGNQNRFEYDVWSNNAWAGVSNFNIGGDFEWGTLVRDVGSDDMALCLVDDANDIAVVEWTGAAWSLSDDREIDSDKTEPGFACVFEDTSGNDNDILLTYSDASATNYQIYDSSATSWSGELPVNSIAIAPTMQLERTGDATILGVFFDSVADDLLFSTWDGLNWSTTTDLTINASVDNPPYGRPYGMAPRNPSTDGTIIVSPPIDFNDGLGPYWSSFSWNDNQPLGTSITYQLQYQTATNSWAFIPNSDLPENETGTTTGPYDLSSLNKNTYSVIRPYATLSCLDADTCPQLQDWTVEWAGGITVSGTVQRYDQSTNINNGTVAVAVNGNIQNGKIGSVSGGAWSIPNVTAFGGDIITVFLNGTSSDSMEAVAVTRYDGQGDVAGFELFERHLSLGSNDATSTPLSNTDIALFDTVNDEDINLDQTGSTLNLCADTACGNMRLYVNASTTFRPGGNVLTHDVHNDGTIIATSTIYVTGSWDNNATTTLTSSAVVMSATSTSESIDVTGSAVGSFNDLTFGTTTGSATWVLNSALDVDGDLTVQRGAFNRGTEEITIAGDLGNGTNGVWNGVGTTTFDGSVSRTWSDQNSTLQNVGKVVIDGSNKIVTLAGNVAAETVTIGADDTLDASNSNYDITVYGNWINNNVFVARSGEVFFAATTTGIQITAGGDAFYDLSFTGPDGGWSFSENTLLVGNDFTIATGTVTLTSATTTISGSFNSAGGQFAHSNGLLLFDSASAETITASGTATINRFNDLRFNGGGSWSFLDTHATATDLVVTQGAVTFPDGTLAIEGTVQDTGGSFSPNGGTVRFFSVDTETIQAGGSSFANLLFDGSGSWLFADTNVTATDDLTVLAGALTLPSGTFTVGGSLANSASITPGTGTVLFNSSDTGETIDLGNSSLYNTTFDSSTGGWTITTSATSTNDLTITSANDLTLSSEQTLAVGSMFTNSVGGASTTWSGSTLYLYGSTPYTVNAKTDEGDQYETILIGSSAGVSAWNSVATTTSIVSGGYFYSQDHDVTDGALYIYGDYVRTSGAEYWSHLTDFDGVDLGTSSARLADVRLASGATVTLSDSLLEVVGSTTASSTIQNQGSGTYTISVSGGTTTAQYYDFQDLGVTGVSLLASTTVTSLRDGSFTVAAAGGTALTIASTTIDTNPAKQIYNVTFATTTAISANNVTQAAPVSNSYWWFRDSKGNIDGESFDLDPDVPTGNPGTIRWDDSALQVTIAGSVLQDDEVSAVGGNTCNGVATPVRIVVQDGATYDTTCAAGSYSFGPVVIVGDPIVTVFLNGAADGEQAVTVTKTVTGDILDLDLIDNRVITRHEDVSPLTIADMAVYDYDDDTDIPFTASTTSDPDLLTVFADHELHIASTTTFAPGGTVTLRSGGTGNSYDGSLHIADDAIFTGAGTTTYTIGGVFTLGANATFTPALSTVLMSATTSGKAIVTDAADTLTLHELQFTGIDGAWNIAGNISATGDIFVATGTVTGTGDITLTAGEFYGNGLVSLGGGEVSIASSSTLGGTRGWTFNDLTLGNGVLTGTTTPGSNATTTVGGTLTIETGHFLDAGASLWNLSGTGTVFVENGTFLEDASTVRYSGTAATDILSTDYYNLTLDALAGSPTYTATGLGIQVFNDLEIAPQAATAVTFEIGVTDPALNVDGDFTVHPLGAFTASDSGVFTLAGNYNNNGTFSSSGGTVTFDGSGTHTIAAGNSDFATAIIDGIGDFTITEHATATDALTLTNANTVTVNTGQTVAVGGTFTNSLDGTETDWNGSTLYLYGGGNYAINDSTTGDRYDTLLISGNTQIRSWNSSATTTTVGAGSLYSMDHASTSGELYIFGDYQKTTGIDYWSYATDFDGASLGTGRAVTVSIENGGSVTFDGTSQLSVLGSASASTTIQNQGSGVYAFTATGTASTTMNYYAFSDVDADGVTFGGDVNVVDISRGLFLVANNNDSAITVYGSALNSSPARTFSRNIFATTSGVTTATNVTATGSAVSSWRFALHRGDIDGEGFDDDNGDPGRIAWDDSANLITVSGDVYQNNRSSVSTACGAATNIHLYVDGNPAGTASCNGGTYTITNVAYSSSSDLVVFIDGEPEKGVTVTKEPISDILNLDIYEDHVIVRHEGTVAITNSDLDSYDGVEGASGDGDIPYVVNSGDLVVEATTTLLVWNNKEFDPNGDVTVTGNDTGAAYDGTVELLNGATFTGGNGEIYTIGGSLLTGVGATFDADTATTTFTSNFVGRTVNINDDDFYNLELTGTGDWLFTDTILDVQNFRMTAGSTTLPSGTTTVSGNFNNTGGTFNNNGTVFVFDGAGTDVAVRASSSDFSRVRFTGTGNWLMVDTNATATDAVTIEGGSVSLPSGALTVDGSFENTAGVITHNTSLIRLVGSANTNLRASGSDLYAVTRAGSGTTTMTDVGVTLLDSLTVESGHMVLATGTLSIGGSFTATGGTFYHSTGTVLFNSGDTGEVINPGASDFYNVRIANGAGGWTVTGNATTTQNLILTSASDLTINSGVVLTVGNVFRNYVGGAATTWNGSTLRLISGSEFYINTKSSGGGDDYETLIVAADTDVESWASQATTTIVAASGSWYSQNHSSTSGSLYIYGDYNIGTTTEYWSYATDFNGDDLSGGSERPVTVRMATSATTTVLSGGSLQIVGASGNETVVTNQGSGQYGLLVIGGTFNSQYAQYRNLNSGGLNISGTPIITSLNYSDFELVLNGGTLITLASSSLNANASKVITGMRFATTTAITGTNIALAGTTSNAWTFTSHTGNLSGEDFDDDGITACGSLRWDDSSCLLIQQTHYRWRNDDGGLGAPDTEWFNASWGKRKPVRIDNNDATEYTDAVIELTVDYDSDMQSDFDDLRFTDSSGTSTIPHFTASTTVGVSAEVWVKVPTLPANDTATVYMYYNNAVATSSASSTLTFIAADDFEDGDLNEYDGAGDDKALFTADGTQPYGSSFALANTGNTSGKADDGGIARFDQTINQGNTIRYMQYVDLTGNDDEVCTLFGVTSPVDNNTNYGVCFEQIVAAPDYIAIVEDVVQSATPGNTLASTTVSFSAGWYEVEIDWGADDSINVYLYDDKESLVATATTTDGSKTSGGYGFTYWFNGGSWDNFSVRPTLTTEPTIRFGAETIDGGASWAAAQDTQASYNQGDIARLRLAVENSGLAVTNQNFDLEYADKDAAPSCEAVAEIEYIAVPNQASCGSSPLCMQTTSNYTNNAATTDLLTGTEGVIVAGQAIEDPSNSTGNIDIDQSEFTELEYAITPTVNATGTAYCLRVSNGGDDLDTYLSVAELTMVFDPVLTNITFNNGADITLVQGTTTRVYATGTVTDLNGVTDIVAATSTMYRSGAGAACAADDNNCYISAGLPQCRFTDCNVGTNSCTVECYADFQYHADATDDLPYEGEEWLAFIEVVDQQGGFDLESAIEGVELITLRAISASSTIDYGAGAASSTLPGNATTTVRNIGNDSIDVKVTGTDMSDGGSSVIPARYQRYATSTFNYSGCGITTCPRVSSTAAISLELDLQKPTAATPPITDFVYWGIAIPYGVNSAPHSGLNSFIATDD